MRLVADHLKDCALKTSQVDEREQFGRTAFNRYYYASFLIIREGFRRMEYIRLDEELPHSNVPERLQGGLAKKFKKAEEKARKVDDSSLARQLFLAARAATELATMMDMARATRTLADYAPEKPIELARGGFSLMEVEIETAKSWPLKTEAFMLTIESAWKQITT